MIRTNVNQSLDRRCDSGLTANQSSRPCKPLQVPAALADLEHHIAQLTKSVSILRERLEPVLRREPCETDSEKAFPEPPPSALYDVISFRSREVNNVSAQITELLRLLEI